MLLFRMNVNRKIHGIMLHCLRQFFVAVVGLTWQSKQFHWIVSTKSCLQRLQRLFCDRPKWAANFWAAAARRLDIHGLLRYNISQSLINFNILPVSWLLQEDARLLAMVEVYGLKQWTQVASALPCRGSKQCCERYGTRFKNQIVLRCPTICLSDLTLCGFRYKHHLSPDIIKDSWTRHEDLAIVNGQSCVGNKWAEMWEHESFTQIRLSVLQFDLTWLISVVIVKKLAQSARSSGKVR